MSSTTNNTFHRLRSAAVSPRPGGDREGVISTHSAAQQLRQGQLSEAGYLRHRGGINFSSNNRKTSNVPSSFASQRPTGNLLAPATSSDDVAGNPSSGTSGNGDPGDILDYGMSVEVMEDCRRGTAQEINEIQKSIKDTEGKIRQELEQEKQLHKDVSYSQREMQSLRQGTEDEYGKAATHRAFVSKLKGDYELQIALPVKSTTSPGTDSSSPGPHPVTPEARPANKPADKHHSDTTNDTMANLRAKICKELFDKLRGYVQTLEEGTAKVEEILEKRRLVIRVMEDHGLSENLKRTRGDEQKFREEYRQNENYQKSLLDTIGAAKDSYASVKREIADNTKHLNELRRAHNEWEIDEKKKLETCRAKTEAIHSKKAEASANRDSRQAEMEKLKNIVDRYQVFSEKKDAFQTELTNVATKKSELDKRKQMIKEKLEAQNQLLREADRRLHDSEKAMEAAENLRDANDEIEMTIVVPAKEEISANEQRKLDICKRLVEIEKEDRSTQQDQSLRLAEMEQANEKVVKVIANVATALQAKKGECLELDRAHQDFMRSLEAEIEETKKRRDQLNDVTKTMKVERTAAFCLAALKSAVALLDEAEAIEKQARDMKVF